MMLITIQSALTPGEVNDLLEGAYVAGGSRIRTSQNAYVCAGSSKQYAPACGDENAVNAAARIQRIVGRPLEITITHQG